MTAKFSHSNFLTIWNASFVFTVGDDRSVLFWLQFQSQKEVGFHKASEPDNFPFFFFVKTRSKIVVDLYDELNWAKSSLVYKSN